MNKDSKQRDRPSPKIAEGGQRLPRIARIQLAQLRIGYCPLLKFYLSRIWDNVDNRCPKCDVAPHEVNHIFKCSKNTTNLKLIDQWERPVEVAKWLNLITSFLHNHTAQNNPPSLPLSPSFDDAPTVPLTRGPHFIHHGVDAERSTHHKQAVYRQSHTTTNISGIFMSIIMMQK